MNYMTTETPPSPRERLAEWSAKAWRSGYDFVTGPRQQDNDYAAYETLDGKHPTTEMY